MNEELLNTLPELPFSKQYQAKFTPEQLVVLRYIQTGQLDKNDEKTLQEGIEFYDKCFPYLKKINLSTITDKQAKCCAYPGLLLLPRLG